MTAGADDARIVAEGDVPKVEPTRHHFAALIAGLKTAEECARVVERERDALATRVDSLEARLRTALDVADDVLMRGENDGSYNAHVIQEAINRLNALRAAEEVE